MYKELKIFRDVKPSFKLKRWDLVTPQHLRLYFENSTLEYDDVIWSQLHLDLNDRKSIFVVEHAYDDQSVRVRLADSTLVDKFNFNPGDIFLQIASFKDAST